MTIETNILSQLINSESYARKVLPFLKEEYFQTVTDRLLVTKIKQYMDKYNVPPSKEALIIELGLTTANSFGPRTLDEGR